MLTVIDCNAVCHAAKHSMGSLSYNEKRTGVIFGFIRQMYKLAKEYGNDFVFCWDSKKSIRKEKYYTEYKENRTSNKTEADKELDKLTYPQFDLLRTQILPQLGYSNIFMKEGYESDDLIATLFNKGVDMTIATSDSDLYQLLVEGEVLIYDLSKKKTFTEADFQRRYMIEPYLWAEVKALAGCDTDNVKGIQGVGVVTAIKYLKGDLKKSTVAYKRIIESKEIIDRNRKLVSLPFENTPKIEVKYNQPSLKGFISMCQRYGFESMLYKESIEKYKKELGLK